MKKHLNHRLIIFALGVIFIASAFLVGVFSLTYVEDYSHIACSETLPEGVHIPININTADSETLCLIEGIGVKTAEKIIDYRNTHGNLTSTDEIMSIKGIGEKTYDKIKSYLCV